MQGTGVMKKFVRIVEQLNDVVGRIMGWLMLALVLLVTIDVIARYVFNFGMVIVQESEWWLFSMIFLSCAGYTFLYEEHVRVDIIYSRLNKKWKNIVDLTCSFLFLFPMCVLLVWTSLWFIRDSWIVGEVSPDPGGYCCYYVLKSFIPFGFLLLSLQGIVTVYKIIQELRGFEPEAALKDSLSARVQNTMDTK